MDPTPESIKTHNVVSVSHIKDICNKLELNTKRN